MANKVIPSLKFNHIALKVPDFDKSLRFYTEGLGMKVYAKWGSPEKTIALLDIGDGSFIELFNNGEVNENENAGYIHLALGCDDVDAAYARALEYGAKPKIAPKTVSAHSEPNDIVINCAFVIAPGGEQVEFFRIISSTPAV